MTASLARPTASAHTVCQPSEQVTSRESFNNRGEWVTQAHCRDIDPEELFVKGAAQRKAVAICRHCPVVLQCRADALDNRVEFGVWGGMTERQRRALLRKHPEIDSWADFFAGQLATASES
ncbi:WhiB family transcriptional regulator [Corynebacterium dentalis]|uniref:WhiB family transcriptional regulator n=1 Tax=Corynebacterium dentalis TaxID=2014528 RepID=UPI0028A1457D|nr:WhiB family transcriptional regulator [Corynebacterium dentalis]